MNRRSFLGAAGAAIVAGPSLARKAVAAPSAQLLAGIGPLPADDLNSYAKGRLIPDQAKTVIKTFEEWLAAVGEDYLRDRARHVSHLDPDIALLRLPLTTQVRMQRERQYQRLLADRRKSIPKAILQQGGEMTVWLD